MTEKQSYIRGCLFAISKMESDNFSRLEDIGNGYKQIDIPWKKITDWLKAEYEKEMSDKPSGKWIKVHPLQENDEGGYMCSECKCGGLVWKPTTYCPNCGAKMVEPQESED